MESVARCVRASPSGEAVRRTTTLPLHAEWRLPNPTPHQRADLLLAEDLPPLEKSVGSFVRFTTQRGVNVLYTALMAHTRATEI